MSHSDGLDPEGTAEALVDEGRKVRDFIKSSRSDTLLRLFDFLLQQSIEGRQPREAEIATEVFQEGPGLSATQGSRVRVGVHRLRKKLDLYYADKRGARLVIPQGKYGLTLKSSEAASDEVAISAGRAPRRAQMSVATILVVSALLVTNVALGWFRLSHFVGSRGPAPPSQLWRAFGLGSRPTSIAIGDYFMFISTKNGDHAEELTQDLAIDTSDAFYDYVASTAGVRGSVRDENLHTVSSDLLGPLSTLWSYLRDFKPVPVSSSELDPGLMRSSNIVYVGALDALTPLLANPLFQASQFRCAATCYELIDKSSDHHFRSDSPYLLGDGIIPRRDYGYIASFPGPSGNQILIVSGTGDAGVTQMVSVVTDPKKVDQLRKTAGGDFKSFEALYQVRTMFYQSYRSTLLVARPINTDGIWDKSKPMIRRLAPEPAA